MLPISFSVFSLRYSSLDQSAINWMTCLSKRQVFNFRVHLKYSTSIFKNNSHSAMAANQHNNSTINVIKLKLNANHTSADHDFNSLLVFLSFQNKTALLFCMSTSSRCIRYSISNVIKSPPQRYVRLNVNFRHCGLDKKMMFFHFSLTSMEKITRSKNMRGEFKRTSEIQLHSG